MSILTITGPRLLYCRSAHPPLLQLDCIFGCYKAFCYPKLFYLCGFPLPTHSTRPFKDAVLVIPTLSKHRFHYFCLLERQRNEGMETCFSNQVHDTTKSKQKSTKVTRDNYSLQESFVCTDVGKHSWVLFTRMEDRTASCLGIQLKARTKNKAEIQ